MLAANNRAPGDAHHDNTNVPRRDGPIQNHHRRKTCPKVQNERRVTNVAEPVRHVSAKLSRDAGREWIALFKVRFKGRQKVAQQSLVENPTLTPYRILGVFKGHLNNACHVKMKVVGEKAEHLHKVVKTPQATALARQLVQDVITQLKDCKLNVPAAKDDVKGYFNISVGKGGAWSATGSIANAKSAAMEAVKRWNGFFELPQVPKKAFKIIAPEKANDVRKVQHRACRHLLLKEPLRVPRNGATLGYALESATQ